MKNTQPVVRWMAIVLLTMGIGSGPAGAASRNWKAGVTGDWEVAANWVEEAVPGPGDDVSITNRGARAILSSPSSHLNSCVISNAVLVFTNWTTSLTATNVIVWPAGTITVANAFTTNQMSNRVWIICTNLTVATNGTINVDGLGYWRGNGPGRGTNSYGGAGYGGKGGDDTLTGGGMIYGSSNAPTDPGSGGANSSGGHGGGAIWIEADGGTVRVDGVVSANGAPGASGLNGGGSGGSIYIRAGIFGGSTNGWLRVDGGNSGAQFNYPGAGGGGRIAILYNGLDGVPGARFSANIGEKSYTAVDRGFPYPMEFRAPEIGTLFFSNPALLNAVLAAGGGTGTMLNGYVYFASTQIWERASLVLSNSTLGIPSDYRWVITNQMQLATGGVVMAPYSALAVGGDVAMTQGAIWRVYAGETNAVRTPAGSYVDVGGAVVLASNCWIHPFSHSTNGGSVRFRLGQLTIQPGGGIDASGRGYARQRGEGKGTTSSGIASGAGYGGRGGDSLSGYGAKGGPAYGSTNVPLQAGSGGGYDSSGHRGGSGGGLIWLEVAGNVTVNGSILANGAHGVAYGGGGSGGGIFISCTGFQGSVSGILAATGGNAGPSYPGGGAGGRISVAVGLDPERVSNLVAGLVVAGLHTYSNHAAFAGVLSVTNGIGYANPPAATNAYPGSQVFLTTNLYRLTLSGFPGRYDSPMPLGYGTTIDLIPFTEITNSVTSPTDQTGGLRRACIGWTLADEEGGAIDSGVTTQAIFTLSTNLVLTWHWTNEYVLIVTNGGTTNGSVNAEAVNGWYTNGTTVTGILATASNGYYFDSWTGSDVPAGMAETNPLTVTMDQARTLTASFASLAGGLRTWTGSGVWESATNWVPSGKPGPNDDAYIVSGAALFGLSRSVRTLTVSNGAALVFSNWTACLTASNIAVLGGGTITVANAFTTNQMSNRVWMVCTNLTVATNGVIHADGLGYWRGNGPGRGTNIYGGGGYGGKGGDDNAAIGGGLVYGLVSAPSDPGSGGANSSGGHGGGAIWIEALTGTVRVDGVISANGAAGASGLNGGGSGGSIYIRCGIFGGSTSGWIRANGGDSGAQFIYPGAGGGGRVTLLYEALDGTPGLRLTTHIGRNSWKTVDYSSPQQRVAPEMGTLYFSDPDLMNSLLACWGGTATGVNGYLHFESTNIWEMSGLILSNAMLGIPESNEWRIAGDLAMTTGQLAVASYGRLDCAGDIRLQQGSVLRVYSGATNGIGQEYGARVEVGGELEIGSACWLYPFSHSADGGSVYVKSGSATILAGGGIDADGRGYRVAAGPGKGFNSYGGAGHGGRGGHDNGGAGGGPAYGVTNGPTEPGSGGKGNGYGRGGGVIRLDVGGALNLDGTISASGLYGGNGGYGGGAGGAIYINAAEFTGEATGILRADGGEGGTFFGYPGGGAGGRIAVWVGVSAERRASHLSGHSVPGIQSSTHHVDFAGTVSVTNGLGWRNPPDPAAAEIGSAVFLSGSLAQGTVFLFY